MVWKVAAYTALGLGLMLLGGLLGHYLTPPTVVAEPGISVPESVDLTDLETIAVDAATVMPDVLGLDSQTAQRVLRDAGIEAGATTVEREVAGPPGLVVEQSPLPGDEVTGPVSWVESVPVVMPELAGETAQTGTQVLTELGAAVQITRRVAPAESPGTILATDPEAGSPVPTAVTIEVSDPGEALPLTELSSVDREGDCSRLEQTATVGGAVVEQSIRCRVGPESPAMVEYNLARHAEALRTVVGVDDAGRQGTGQVRLLVDGQERQTLEIASGDATEVLLDVSGGLRLRLEVVGGDEEGRVEIIFGDAALLADTSAVELLRSL